MNSKIRHLREQLKRLDLEGMIISNPINIKYLTNIESEGTLIITRKENIFITYTMYIEEVNSILTINDEIVVADVRDITKEEYENFFLFCENVGFEEKYVTYDKYKKLKQTYKINNLVETECIIEKQREIKDEEEIEKIQKACKITDDCFTHILEYIKKDMTEEDIAIEINRCFKLKGADGVAFDTIVAFGENSAKPHWKPSKRKIATGEPILIDMGCKYKGYCSDMTRTIFMGCILEEIKSLYDLVLRNEEASIIELGKTNSIKTVTKRVQNELKSKGMDLIHALGHGVGLEVHETPFINTKNEEILKDNMVIAVEPGIYIPGKYGIRIEDTVVITKDGSITLTKSNKNYIVL